MSGNGGDLTIDTGSVGGAIDVSGTGGDLAIVGSVGEAIDVSGTGGDLTIDPGTVGGDLDLSDNPDAGAINVGDGQIGGDLTITDDGTAVVNANDSLTVSGDADVETDGGGMLDLSGVEADGDETVAADGADGVTADTAGGTTDVSILGGTAAMHVVLPDGAFDQRGGVHDHPRAATTRRRPAPRSGGAPAQVDPLAGYAFAFAVPTLNADARLSFTIDLAALDAGTRAALLAAIASGTATIVTKADAPGSVYGAFARCTGTQTPEANGCVAVTLLAAGGSVAPPGQRARVRPLRRDRRTLLDLRGRAGQHDRPGRTGRPPPPRASTPLARPRRRSGRCCARRSRRAARRRGSARCSSMRLPAAVPGARRRHREGRVVPGCASGHKPVLIASGRHRFAAAGSATITVKLTAAGRRQLRRAKRLGLTAKGTFTSSPGAPVTAARRFTLRR